VKVTGHSTSAGLTCKLDKLQPWASYYKENHKLNAFVYSGKHISEL